MNLASGVSGLARFCWRLVLRAWSRGSTSWKCFNQSTSSRRSSFGSWCSTSKVKSHSVYWSLLRLPAGSDPGKWRVWGEICSMKGRCCRMGWNWVVAHAETLISRVLLERSFSFWVGLQLVWARRYHSLCGSIWVRSAIKLYGCWSSIDVGDEVVWLFWQGLMDD
jgi:hypothetical protein